MVVTDDVALVVGRELLGYPKKLAKISLRGQLVESVDLVVTQFPWMLARRQ